MKPFDLSSPVIHFIHPEYGARLLFKNGVINPRDELGKNGVTFHSWFDSFFYKTIPIKTTLITEQGEQRDQIFYVNRNSLIKYLGEDAKTDDQILIDHLEKGFLNNDGKNSAGSALRHAGRHNRIAMSGFFAGIGDYIKATFLGRLYQNTIGSISGLVERLLFVKTEKDLFDAGEVLAKQRYKDAYARVPAYKEHITRFDGLLVNAEFRNVPVTSKDNYIKYNQKHDWDTHVDGRYPEGYKKDTSTGTTGKATPWIRGEAELETVKKSLQLAARLQFGERKLSYINAFALGPWATGLTTYELMRETGSVFATGPDKEKILEHLISIVEYDQHRLESQVDKFAASQSKITIEQKTLITELLKSVLTALVNDKELTVKEEVFKQFYAAGDEGHRLMDRYRSKILAMANELNAEKQQVILAGYPPFLKDFTAFVDAKAAAARQAGEKAYTMKDFSAVGIVGGQGISEAMRDQLVAHGFNKIYSSYGASDLDINLGAETDYEILVRKTIEKNPGLARELHGPNKGSAMVFHFDPLNNHVEVDENDELIFTTTRDDRSSPRVRYDLGDKGRVYASSDIQAALAKYGVFQKPKSNLPIMLVWGRDSTVVFHGANVGFTELERAITDDHDLESIVCKKSFYTYENEEGVEQLEIWLELNDNIELPDEDTAQQYTHNILNSMVLMNQDFRYQVANLTDGTPLPAVRFYKRGESPISEPGGHRKQVLIFQKDVNLEKGYTFPTADKCYSSVITKTDAILQPKAAVASLSA